MRLTGVAAQTLGALGLFGILVAGSMGLVGCTMPNPDYVAPCQLGERVCAQSSARPTSLVCGLSTDGEATLLEDPCPLDTRCETGRCVPGVGARTCANQSECAATEACTPLVLNDGGLGSFCVTALTGAPAAAGTACQRDSDCQTYRCLQHARGRFCLKSCATDASCGPSARCLGFSLTISGVQGMVRSCSPL